MKVEYLPYDGRIEKTIHVALAMISGLTASGGNHLLEEAREAVEKIRSKIEDPVRFQFCKCGCGGGKISYKHRDTAYVFYKTNALILAKHLYNSENINGNEYETLKKKIEESPLVD